MQNDCAEIKIRAERKAGKILGSRPGQTSNRLLPEGVSRMQSSRWQLMAELPEAEVSRRLREARRNW